MKTSLNTAYDELEQVAKGICGKRANEAGPDDYLQDADVRLFPPVNPGRHDNKSPILFRSFDGIQSKPIDWLWPGRFARGKYSVIAGNPGLAKSQITISMAAAVSMAWPWPAGEGTAPLGSTVFLSAEDDAEDTIKPRLMASGADVAKIFKLDAVREGTSQRSLNLRTDIDHVKRLMDQIGNVRLFVIDPISAYLGKTDSFKDADVRATLAPLSDLAADYGVAIVAVAHLNKNQAQDAIHRVGSSVAFTAAARSAYVVTRDKDSPGRRLFLPLKNNLASDESGLAYRVEGLTLEDGIASSRVVWEREPVLVSASEAMGPTSADGDPPHKELERWLRDLLAPGRLDWKAIQSAARNAGYENRTVQRALKEGGFAHKREGFGPDMKSFWSLPPLVP